jgi:hypothetical protein
VFAFFGAPLDLPDHAFRSCLSAITMRRLEQELNLKYQAEGLSPTPVLTRIGINTGDMVVGNMGTQNKMNYTIMGNAVNLAARLEGVNKQYGTWILATEDTVKEAGDQIVSRYLDQVRVVGISTPVRIYEILETAEGASPEMLKTVELFNRGKDLFDRREWAAAAAAFEAVLNHAAGDGPAEIYRQRCEEYRNTPPPADWDGVFNLSSK